MLQRRTDRTFAFLEELQIKKKLKKRKKVIWIENNFSKDLDSTCSRKQSNQIKSAKSLKTYLHKKPASTFQNLTFVCEKITTDVLFVAKL